MSALLTALVEGETKEKLAASLIEHREALRVMLSDYRTEGCPMKDCLVCSRSRAAEEKAKAVLASVVVHDAGPSRVTVTSPPVTKSPTVS